MLTGASGFRNTCKLLTVANTRSSVSRVRGVAASESEAITQTNLQGHWLVVDVADRSVATAFLIQSQTL